MKRTILAISLSVAVAGCETQQLEGPPPPGPPPPSAAPFRARDFSWSAERGSASIHGQVAFSDGSARYSCAGQPVILTPDAPFSRARMVALYGSDQRAALPVSVVRGRQANRPSDDYNAFVRRATCDPQQRFAFQGLPAGSWYVIVVAQPAAAGAESMALMHRVTTREGSAKSLTIQ